MSSLRSLSRPVGRRDSLGEVERGRLLDEFNAAVRCPSAHGGVAWLPLLLDTLAVDADRSDGARWIVDDNARLDMAAAVRSLFPQPEIHVVAAEYGAAAHRRGWLRVDRVLVADEHTHLVETTKDWARTDRSLDDVLTRYGAPSVVFGDQDPHSAKTLGYAPADPAEPLAVFHFGEAEDTSSAPLLAFRSGHDTFGTSIAFTPLGKGAFYAREKHRD
ncbi:hypothetical protein [Streptomyces aureus]|uniref:hypothetical protein n=1 Tax=Streptomyces aureus TaxID=193461 RepID=UPI0006919081|nr:hypothetical protein [Streptomyces aureus]